MSGARCDSAVHGGRFDSGKPRLLFYCQHVLGMGHFTRSIEIVKGLAGFDVVFLNGGDRIENFELPAGVEFVDLPPIRTDADFRRIEAGGGALDLEQVKQARTALILETCERIGPAVAVIELFPFGRRKFAFELVPMLEQLRRSGTRIACSLRDIVVGKDDQAKFEERTRRLIRQYFDLLLIHSDPRFQRLEETFESAAALACETHYTGFVMQPTPPRRARAGETPLIVVSIGGGRVGGELLECAIRASAIIAPSLPHRMLAFSGPFVTEEEWGRASEAAAHSPSVTLERFNPRFLDCLANADLSISMAGYNTCMNVIATGVRALVYPFTGGDNEEQTTRARKLERLGAVKVLRASDLTPGGLGQSIVRSLSAPAPGAIVLDTNGVARTAELLARAVAREAA
jgi:predicted glycosyltransferase